MHKHVMLLSLLCAAAIAVGCSKDEPAPGASEPMESTSGSETPASSDGMSTTPQGTTMSDAEVTAVKPDSGKFDKHALTSNGAARSGATTGQRAHRRRWKSVREWIGIGSKRGQWAKVAVELWCDDGDRCRSLYERNQGIRRIVERGTYRLWGDVAAQSTGNINARA